MHDAAYYREQAARARHLAIHTTDEEAGRLLLRMSQDYRELAEDLELNAIEIRHPELLPQRRHHQAE